MGETGKHKHAKLSFPLVGNLSSEGSGQARMTFSEKTIMPVYRYKRAGELTPLYPPYQGGIKGGILGAYCKND